jgi:hypothetical protein
MSDWIDLYPDDDRLIYKSGISNNYIVYRSPFIGTFDQIENFLNFYNLDNVYDSNFTGSYFIIIPPLDDRRSDPGLNLGIGENISGQPVAQVYLIGTDRIYTLNSWNHTIFPQTPPSADKDKFEFYMSHNIPYENGSWALRIQRKDGFLSLARYEDFGYIGPYYYPGDLWIHPQYQFGFSGDSGKVFKSTEYIISGNINTLISQDEEIVFKLFGCSNQNDNIGNNKFTLKKYSFESNPYVNFGSNGSTLTQNTNFFAFENLQVVYSENPAGDFTAKIPLSFLYSNFTQEISNVYELNVKSGPDPLLSPNLGIYASYEVQVYIVNSPYKDIIIPNYGIKSSIPYGSFDYINTLNLSDELLRGTLFETADFKYNNLSLLNAYLDMYIDDTRLHQRYNLLQDQQIKVISKGDGMYSFKFYVPNLMGSSDSYYNVVSLNTNVKYFLSCKIRNTGIPDSEFIDNFKKYRTRDVDMLFGPIVNIKSYKLTPMEPTNLSTFYFQLPLLGNEKITIKGYNFNNTDDQNKSSFFPNNAFQILTTPSKDLLYFENGAYNDLNPTATIEPPSVDEQIYIATIPLSILFADQGIIPVPNNSYTLNVINGYFSADNYSEFQISFTNSGTDDLTDGNTTLVNNTTPVCFKEDSKISCLVNNEEKEIKIQDVKVGTLVKTLYHGYLPVKVIGKNRINNLGDKSRIKDRLYKLSKNNYSELNEDLYLTGCHAILVNELSDVQIEKIKSDLGRIFITEDKYRLPTYIDERSEPYEKESIFNIYHLALESNESNVNHGIYANGLLVETCFENRIINQMFIK